jgi:hypothetical protein
LGEQLVATDFPEISLKIHSTDGKEKRARIFLIRNGKVVKREGIVLPYELKWIDSKVDMSQPVYYRLNVIASPVDHLVANPIFVKFGKSASVVASVASVETQKVETEKPVIEEPAPPSSQSPKPPEVAKSQKIENPKVARLEPPEAPRMAKVPTPAPAPVPAKVPKLPSPVAIDTPARPKVKSPEPANEKNYLRVLIDCVSLKQGPGAIFAETERVNKGDRLLFVRRTKISFNGKVWLVVKYKDRLAYVWEGLVKME